MSFALHIHTLVSMALLAVRAVRGGNLYADRLSAYGNLYIQYRAFQYIGSFQKKAREPAPRDGENCKIYDLFQMFVHPSPNAIVVVD